MQVDETHYRNWTNFISSLRSNNIRTLTYVNPMLSNVTERGTPYHRNLYAEALTRDFAVKKSSKEVWTGYGDSILVDLTNPDAVKWFKDIIKQVTLAMFFVLMLCLSGGTNVTGDIVIWSGWLDV